MDSKERKEQLKQAKRFMQPGHFQRAAEIYGDLGLAEQAQGANLNCAINCLDSSRYALAMEYFKKAKKDGLATRLEAICLSAGLQPSMQQEMYPCGPHCPSYSAAIIGLERSDALKAFYTVLDKEKFMKQYRNLFGTKT